MSPLARWAQCVRHRGPEARAFLEGFLGQQHRQMLLIAGAGFDPRSTVIPALVGRVARSRTRALFLREVWPNPPEEHTRRAGEHAKAMQQAVTGSQVVDVRVFSTGSMAITGGREAVRAVAACGLTGVTDVVLDVSALSIGVAFPVVRYVLEHLDQGDPRVNLHLVLVDEPDTDRAIRAIAGDSVETMAGFKGGFGLDRNVGAARHWLPQLDHGLRQVLRRIHDFVTPDGVAPILPFPSSIPRLGDELLEEYLPQIESAWQVDIGDLIYADEKLPIDLYRTILDLGDKRQRVFDGVGGSLVVLSPVGSKVLALGALLAAIERDLPVVYVESVGFTVDLAALDTARPGSSDVVHLWLRGEADPCPAEVAGIGAPAGARARPGA